MRAERLILVGGSALAFGAAFVNVGVVLKTGISVSHLTGDISKLSMGLSETHAALLPDALSVAAAALSFFLGAFLSGLWIHHPSLDFSRPYGRTITGIGMLFILSSHLIPRFPVFGIALAALSCGLQNSLATRYRGIVLRTTHLTGLITDFGITLGMSVRGFEIPAWKIMVPALLTAAFFLGGLCASVCFFLGSLDTILIAGLGYTMAGLCWTLGKHVLWPVLSKN
ncbi:MAG: DUF1275 domain-containing protein [Blastochloris sp.]|nr:DUF1275 domain-containing protein [Blastochloris sp.]